MRQPGGQFLQHHAQLQPGQRRTHATVPAEAEGQMPARALAADVEGFGVLERRFVAVGCREVHQDLVAALDVGAPDGDVTHRSPAMRDDRRAEANALLDGVRNERRVRDDRLPGLGIVEQRQGTLPQLRYLVQGGLHLTRCLFLTHRLDQLLLLIPPACRADSAQQQWSGNL